MKKILITGICLMLLCCSVQAFSQTGYEQHIERTIKPDASRPFEIVLTIDAGEIRIAKNAIPNELYIEMRYSDEKIESSIDFNEKRNRAEIDLNMRSWKKRLDNVEDNDCVVLINLPSDVELLIDSRIKAGLVVMEAGGLRIKEFFLQTTAGEVNVSFDQPNQIEMDMLEIRTRIGASELVNLGNARFKRADIRNGIGELVADFEGMILPGCQTKVSLSIGSAEIDIPRDIGAKMYIGGTFSFLSAKDIDGKFYRRGRFYYNDLYETDENSFLIRITPGLGELSVNH